jgi:hypothetical protein
MPEGATFNGQANVLPPQYLSTLRIGDVLRNEEKNPSFTGELRPPLARRGSFLGVLKK